MSEHLKKENERLHAKVREHENDMREIARGVYLLMNKFNISLDDLANAAKDKSKSRELQKNAMNSVKDLFFEFQFGGGGSIMQEFSFVTDILPVFKKYSYLIEEINDQENERFD